MSVSPIGMSSAVGFSSAMTTISMFTILATTIISMIPTVKAGPMWDSCMAGCNNLPPSAFKVACYVACQVLIGR